MFTIAAFTAGTFAAMLTADVIREVFEAIVTSHKAGVSYISTWNLVKDDRTDIQYPVAFWGPLTTGLVASAEVLVERFTVDMLFVDQTASDRTPLQRDQAHARMDAIAKQVWTRFHDLYIVRSSTWQGQAVDLIATTNPTFLPVFDAETQQRTGVRMTATLQSVAAPECVDTYFN